MAARIASAVDRGCSIRILVQEPSQTPDLERQIEVLRSGGGTIEFRQVSPNSLAAAAQFNFVVSDGSAFRFETDRENHIATACANGGELAQRIEKRFEMFWTTSAQ